MPHWKEEYVSSLKDAELSHPVNMELVSTCSQMADRIAALEAEKKSLESQLTTSDGKAAATDAATTQADGRLRVDLAEAMRSKGTTEARLRVAEEELGKLRTKTKEDSRSLRVLETERASLITRLKDREHELREKRKLLENVQDEMITLNLQVTIAEKERDKVKKENKELIDRWMKRMAQEADAMNRANEPHSENGR